MIPDRHPRGGRLADNGRHNDSARVRSGGTSTGVGSGHLGRTCLGIARETNVIIFVIELAVHACVQIKYKGRKRLAHMESSIRTVQQTTANRPCPDCPPRTSYAHPVDGWRTWSGFGPLNGFEVYPGGTLNGQRRCGPCCGAVGASVGRRWCVVCGSLWKWGCCKQLISISIRLVLMCVCLYVYTYVYTYVHSYAHMHGVRDAHG